MLKLPLHSASQYPVLFNHNMLRLGRKPSRRILQRMADKALERVVGEALEKMADEKKIIVFPVCQTHRLHAWPREGYLFGRHVRQIKCQAAGTECKLTLIAPIGPEKNW